MRRNGKVKAAGNGTDSRYLVEIASKFGATDAPGRAVLGQMPTLGIQSAREVRVSTLYEITGTLTRNQVDHVSKELLSDPITQEYRMDASTPSPAFLVGPHWRIEVWLKPTVTDHVGDSVRKAITDLGLPEPKDVRTGTAYRILGRVSKVQVERILGKLLSNPVIHRTTVAQL